MFKPWRKQIIPTLVLVTLTFTGCGSSGVVKSRDGIGALQKRIVREFGEEGVNVTITTDTILTITFVNSTLNAKTQADRRQRANETAMLVTKHYPAINIIEEVWVGFAKHEKRFLVVNYTEGLESFLFDRHGRPHSANPGAYRDESFNEARPVASFFESRNITDVSIANLQLKGNVNDGLSLSPHFTVVGNANQGPVSPPELVAFDFAYYSDRDVYPEEIPIQILIDEVVAFETKGKFSGARTPEGNYSKFLYVKLSYRQFRRLVDGENVTLVFADDRYPLHPTQLQALQGMTLYVTE